MDESSENALNNAYDDEQEEQEMEEEDEMKYDHEGSTEEIEEELVEFNMERELSIAAVPPKVVPHDENNLEASSSPAFHILDAVSIMSWHVLGFLFESFPSAWHCWLGISYGSYSMRTLPGIGMNE